MYKIAVLGDYDSIYGFAALGMEIFPAEDGEEGAGLLEKLAGSEYGIIYVTEALAAQMRDAIRKYDGQPCPAVLAIPGIAGNTGEGMDRVKSYVERAVGSDSIL